MEDVMVIDNLTDGEFYTAVYREHMKWWYYYISYDLNGDECIDFGLIDVGKQIKIFDEHVREEY